ncbi:MAG: deoxynucleoside kinase [Planctomycetota bacterium]
MTAPLVSIIGPPAVGKTTLAELLAEALSARLVREDYRGNPFLTDASAGKPQARLPAQLYFLISRASQLSIMLPHKQTEVSDYGFCQDRIYARELLCQRDYRLYEKLAARVEKLVRPPDLLVHLDASEDELLRRIQSRGRAFERTMTRDFLARMRNDYNELTGAIDCEVVHIDTESSDPREPGTVRKLADRVSKLSAS